MSMCSCVELCTCVLVSEKHCGHVSKKSGPLCTYVTKNGYLCSVNKATGSLCVIKKGTRVQIPDSPAAVS